MPLNKNSHYVFGALNPLFWQTNQFLEFNSGTAGNGVRFQTHGRTNQQTDRRGSRNSYLDLCILGWFFKSIPTLRIVNIKPINLHCFYKKIILRNRQTLGPSQKLFNDSDTYILMYAQCNGLTKYISLKSFV